MPQRFVLRAIIVAMTLLSAVRFSLAQPVASPAPDQPARRAESYRWMSLEEWNERHEQNLDRKAQGPIDILFLGDSITQGWGENTVWQEYYAEQNAANFGIGGDATQEVLWRITEGGELEGLSPKVVVLLIGTNNIGRPDESEADIARGITKIVSTTREKLPNTRVLVLSVFPRGRTTGDPDRAKVATINDLVAKLDNGDSVRVLDIGARLLSEDGTLTAQLSRDALHLTEAGYEIWAAAMRPLLEEMLAAEPAAPPAKEDTAADDEHEATANAASLNGPPAGSG